MVDQLKKAKLINSQDKLTGTDLLNGLTFTPLEWTPPMSTSPTLTAAQARRRGGGAMPPSSPTRATGPRQARLRTVIRRLQAYADTLDTSPAPAASDATDAPSPRAGFRKMVNPTDTEEASGLPFIAEVRKAGIGQTPLPVIDRPFRPAAEDYPRVGTALERQGLGSDIRVLAICSADPGDGRTMLVANLAHSLARQGREVVLVSSDLRRPTVEKLLGLGQGPGLAENEGRSSEVTDLDKAKDQDWRAAQ
jgi:Mrp family chromosome partitioning ATPase